LDNGIPLIELIPT